MPDQTIRIDLELPKELFTKSRESAQRVKMEALKRLAATFYADGSLSLGKAAELANVFKQEFLGFSAAHNIPPNCDLDELEEDLTSVKEFLQVVSNSATLIALTRIKQVNLLHAVFGRIIIPQGVYNEAVLQGTELPGVEEIREATLFLELCGRYSIQPVHCAPWNARAKGKVENPFRYLEDHFIKGGQWDSFEHFGADFQRFAREELDLMVHGTTRQQPIDLFAKKSLTLRLFPPVDSLALVSSSGK